MAAPVFSLPSGAQQETIDFLRRLSSMLTGGRNAEMLQEAASLIETLGRRAVSAEQLFQDQQEDHARNLELREVAELASDNLLAEVDSLKAEIETLKAEIETLKAEIETLRAQLEEHTHQSETDRNWFAEETLRAQAQSEQAQERAAALQAELDELRMPPPPETIDESIAVVPVQSLQLARTQFDYLAKAFADSGDVVSMTICEIGARALDKALAGTKPD
jgi:predicted RNase H-like nuclease (RuvC/YqgF family)